MSNEKLAMALFSRRPISESLARAQIAALSDFESGLMRPDKCSDVEPIKTTFNPADISAAVGWLATSNYIYGADAQQLAEYDGSGNIVHENVHQGGNLLATYSASTSKWLYAFNDWLGTKRAQVGPNGSANFLGFTSLPYGDNLSMSGVSATEDHFTGKDRDQESGNDYFGARYYSSKVGRWMSPDWAGKPEPVPYANLTDPQTLNLYSYAGNNPLTKTDPDGHCTNGGQQKGFWWCLFNDSDQDAEQARQNLAQLKNISINGKTPADAAKGLNNTQTVNLDRSVTNFLMDNMLSRPGTQLGLALATFGAEGLEARVVSGIEAANGTVITGFTEHGVDRAIGDAAAGTPGARAGTRAQAILDAIKNPTKVTSGIDSQGRPYQVFTGKDARVVVNPSSGRIVSVNPLSGAGAH